MLDAILAKLEILTPKKWRWVLEHSGFKRYAANTSWMFAGQMFSLLAAFFVGAYVARYLGPKNFGLMNYAIIFATILSFLAGFGVENILRRDLVNSPEKTNDLLGTAFWLKISAAVATLVIINIASLYINSDHTSRLLIFVFSWSYILSSFNVIGIYFQTQVLAKKAIQVQISTGIISTIIKLVFVGYDLGVVWIMAVYVIDSLTLATGLTLIYRKGTRNPMKWNFNWAVAKSLLWQSWPLTLAYIMIMIYTKMDQVLLKHMGGEVDLGLYSAAVKISEILYFIPTIICASVFPAIVNARNTDQGSYRDRLVSLYGLMVVLAVLISLPLALTADLFIPALFGPEYQAAAPIFQIYVWSTVPMFLVTAALQQLIVENSTKLYFAISSVGAVSNVLLNLALIPIYAGTGAAIATIISYSLIPLSLVLVRKVQGKLAPPRLGQGKSHKKIVILWHNGGRLANQLWLYISVFAYCADKGYELRNYSFFEYARYFDIQTQDKPAQMLFFRPYTILRSIVAVFTEHADRISTYLFRKYYRACVAIISLFVRGHLVRADADSRPVYLPPSENAFPQFTDFDNNGARSLYLTGWLFRNPVGIAKYRAEIVASFKPRQQYVEAADSVIGALRRQSTNVIGVHIRQGDYRRKYHDGELYFSAAEVSAFCLEFLQKYRLSTSETCFIVCSDGPVAEKEFSNELRITIANNSAIVDLLILASCDYIIGSNSTFAGFASYYGNKPLIVFQRGGIDWNHYRNKSGFFVDPYLTSVHF